MTTLMPADTTAAERSSGGASLRSVLDVLGQGLVRLVTAPRGLDVPLGELVVHDPLGEPAVGAQDLLLAVGVDAARASAVDLVRSVGDRGAAAVLVKADGDPPAALVAAADAAGVALLTAPAAAAWGQLHSLLRSARSVSPPRGDSPAPPLGDLFGLADALAASVGAAVTIEDERATVLAYSTGPHPTDDARRATILGRRVRGEWLERLTEMGVFRRLATSDEVVRVPPLDRLASAPRLAVGVRAGGDALGSIWVQEGDRPLGPEAEQALHEAASLAALHLLRARSGEDLERRRSGEQLRAVLERRLPARLLAETLQVSPDAPVLLVGVQAVAPADAEPGVLSERVADFVVFSCAAFRRKALAAADGPTSYAVLAARTGGPAEARVVAGELADRVSSGLRTALRVVVVDLPDGLAGLAEQREPVDLALRVAADRDLTEVAHIDDLRAPGILLQLRDLAWERPELVAGRVRLLERSDQTRSTDYVATLRAYLDCFGDVRAAADSVSVHPNTFRYRLRRLCELAGLDLDDPEQRLVVHLQLHLLSR